MITKATFLSVWNGGDIEVRTACEVDLETGEIPYIETSKDELANVELDGEYVELPNGDEYPVCPVCHEWLLKFAVIPNENTPTVLEEGYVCRNPDCESNE